MALNRLVVIFAVTYTEAMRVAADESLMPGNWTYADRTGGVKRLNALTQSAEVWTTYAASQRHDWPAFERTAREKGFAIVYK